jgi:hypothetical protein
VLLWQPISGSLEKLSPQVQPRQLKMKSNKHAGFDRAFPLQGLIAVLFVVLSIYTSARGQQTPESTANAQDPISAPSQFTFEDERLRDSIDRLAHSIRLNIVYHVSSLEIVDKPGSILAIHDVSVPGAIDALLDGHRLAQFPIDRRTVVVVDKNHSNGPIASIQAVMERAIAEEAREALRGDDKTEHPERMDLAFRNSTLTYAIENLAYTAHLRVIFDAAIEASTRTAVLTMDLKDVTKAQALQYMLDAYDLKYEEVSGDTIEIVGQNHRHSSTPLEEIVKKAGMNSR